MLQFRPSLTSLRTLPLTLSSALLFIAFAPGCSDAEGLPSDTGAGGAQSSDNQTSGGQSASTDNSASHRGGQGNPDATTSAPATGGSPRSSDSSVTGGNAPTSTSTSSGGATSTSGTSAAGGNSGLGGRVTVGGTTQAGGTSSATTTKAAGGTSSTTTRGVGGASSTTTANPTGGTFSTTKAAGGAVGSGGSLATGGTTTGGGNTGSPAAICNFASGVNVAWVSFANDVPNPSLTAFNTLFKNTYDAGGRIIRWWFHTNGTKTPGYDSSGMTVKLPQSHIDGVKAILSAANTNGVAVIISLWSFDMLQENAGTAYVNNQALLEKDANRQAYVDNYLTPLVTALKGTAGLYAYEIFNEPEGMSEKGWATHKTTEVAIQKTVNWLAAAIHTADPTALVSNGAQTFDYCSNVSGKTNYYSDAELRRVGGKQNGILDFYQVHYYTTNGATNSPFKYPASHWGLDKKLVIGEFYAITQDGVNGPDTYTYLYTNGYNGGWAWQYGADDPASAANNNGASSTKWPTMQTPMKNLFTAHADSGNCP